MDNELPLVEKARNGDRDAFEELVRRTSKMVYAKLYVETGDPHRAEDLTQETFLRAFRNISQLVDPAGFRRWLLTVAQNLAIDSFRRSSSQRRATPLREGQGVLENIPDSSSPPAEDAETREKVRAILQSLPEEYRLPLTLRYIAGADYETITLQLGLTATALRGLLHRGLQLLRRAVKSEVHHESC